MTPVRTLLGAGGIDTAVTCLGSLVRYSADPVRLVVHEDGTLDDGHRDRLRAIDPNVTFVLRPAADAAVFEQLAKHPRCLAFRRADVLALKLFDTPLLSDGPLLYCDSDVLFLRRYAGVFGPGSVLASRERERLEGGDGEDLRSLTLPARQETGRTRPTFMADVRHAYAVRPWRGVRLAGCVNTGIVLAPANYLDLDRLEWALGRVAPDPAFARRRYWAEQTLWAALAGRTGADLLDRRAVVLASRDMAGVTADTVAIHFVSTFRNRLAEYTGRGRPIDEPPAVVGTVPAKPVGPVGLAWADVRRRVGAG